MKGNKNKVFYKKPLSSLEEVNGIKLTLREIDLCACIFEGRSIKKIASLLSLSPKTVENYIHNITQKLNCNSREGIINFLEKSDKASRFKKHYTMLILRVLFEQKLKEISTETKREGYVCLIIYWVEKITDTFLEHFTEEYDGESLMIDATIIRAHPCAAGYEKDQGARECLGRSKGGFTTKIHVVVDALGQALRFSLTPGQRHDITQAPALLQGFENATTIADKGYDSNALIAQLQEQKCIPVIPPRSNRKNPREYDEYLYKERHLVE